MPDTLTADAIAQLLIDARRTSYTLRPGGEKRVTMTLACVEMLCQEVLAVKAENERLKAAIAYDREKVADALKRTGCTECPTCQGEGGWRESDGEPSVCDDCGGAGLVLPATP